RQAFAENAQYEELWRRHYQQWQFHKTRLTASYTRQDFLRDCPADAIIIARLDTQGKLLFRPAKNPQRVGNGDTVIYYAPRAIEPAPSPEAAVDSATADTATTSGSAPTGTTDPGLEGMTEHV